MRIADGDGVGGARIDIGAYERQTVASLNLVVDTLVDESDGNYSAGDLSLREAIGLANGSIGANTITFASALTGGGAATIKLSQGELALSDAVSIIGPTTASLTIDAQQLSRVFNITATTGDFTFTSLRITNGRTTGNNTGGFLTDAFNGGGVRAVTDGHVTFNLCVISSNSTTGESTPGGGIFFLNERGQLIINQSTISGNATMNTGLWSHGGGIASYGYTQINQSVISGNSTAGERSNGGGIYSTAPMRINQSTISGNTTSGNESYGGGILVEGLRLYGSTVSGNSTSGSGASGGGVDCRNITVEDSTVSGNFANAGSGGGLYLKGELSSIIRSTVTNNFAGARGGGIYNATFPFNGPLTITGSIVAGNTAGGSYPDVDLITTSLGQHLGSFEVDYSLIGNTTGMSEEVLNELNEGVGNILNQSPQLGPLANNGGSTFTHALLATSPAINAGDPSAVAGANGVPSFDQRNSSRVAGSFMDMGATEFQTFSTFTVNTLVDENNGIGVGGVSLREAVAAANATSGPSVITFSPTLNGGTIALTSLGQISITKSITIRGPGSGLLTVKAYDPTPAAKTGDGSRVFNVDNGNGATVDLTAVIAGLTLTGGDVTGSGGAISSVENLMLQDVVVSSSFATVSGGGLRESGGVMRLEGGTINDNKSANGGGIQVEGGGSVTVRTTTVRNNQATTGGGGINNSGGLLYVYQSTLNNNAASGSGGGIQSDTTLTGSQFTIVVDSTISANTAASRGGGIYNFDGTTEIRYSTIAFNTATDSTGGGGVASFGDSQTLTRVYSSLITSNVTGDVQFVASTTNSFLSLGYNIVSSGNALANFNQTGDQVVVSVPLNPLADNGGPTKTHSISAGSIAIDKNGQYPVIHRIPTTDQRGFDRDVDGNGINDGTFGSAAIDIGSFELVYPTLPGDYNHDQAVNGGDYVLWRKLQNQTGVSPYTSADGDGDTTIDPGDYTVWRSNYGRTAPGAGAGATEEALAVDSPPLATGGTSSFTRAEVASAKLQPATLADKVISPPADPPLFAGESITSMTHRFTFERRTVAGSDRDQAFASLLVLRGNIDEPHEASWTSDQSPSDVDDALADANSDCAEHIFSPASDWSVFRSHSQ